MKKFINAPEHLVSELLEGYALAYPQHVRLHSAGIVTRREPKAPGKVRLVTLGGAGHEPGLSGFVGLGMLDASVVGGIFAAPSSNRVLDGLRTVQGEAGTLLVVLNHSGDVLSSDLAMEMAAEEGLDVRRVMTYDDISTSTPEHPEQGRGLVGFLPVYKIAGAAAEEGMSMAEVEAVATRVRDNTVTLAVATQEATSPVTGQMIGDPAHALGPDEMEIGMGQHGEAGTGRTRLATADATAELTVRQLCDRLQPANGSELLVLLSGSGSTTHMELFIVFRAVHRALLARGLAVARSAIGEYITTQEQGGFQLMLTKLDNETRRLWDAACDTPYFTLAASMGDAAA